jgi:hypothetical protein
MLEQRFPPETLQLLLPHKMPQALMVLVCYSVSPSQKVKEAVRLKACLLAFS